jgi:hypothetical protein
MGDEDSAEDVTLMSTEDPNPFEKGTRSLIGMYFGSAAVSFAAVLQILQLPSLDTALTVALYCFSISIPINVFMGYIWTYLWEVLSHRTAFWSEIIGTTANYGIAPVGICAIFWHFSSSIGITFLISGVLGGVYSATSVGRADIERRDEYEANFDRRRRGGTPEGNRRVLESI